MGNLWRLIALCGCGLALWLWYRRETIHEGEALVHLQSEHEHFHLHVDLPPGLEIEAGDTLEILETPQRNGQTAGEISYPMTLPVDDPRFFRHLDACVAYDARLRELESRTDPLAAAAHAPADGNRRAAPGDLPPAANAE